MNGTVNIGNEIIKYEEIPNVEEIMKFFQNSRMLENNTVEHHP